MDRRSIPGFSDYAADDSGQLWTRRKKAGGGKNPYGQAKGPWRLQPMQFDQRVRYQTVRVGADGADKRKRMMVHSLVALAFLGPRPAGMQIAHGSSGAMDNSPGNLSYKTPAQNKADEIRDGTRYKGDRHHNAGVKSTAWPELLTRWLAGIERKTDLCREFGVSRTTVHRRLQRDICPHESAGALEGLILGGA